jgi:hypothetical protein
MSAVPCPRCESAWLQGGAWCPACQDNPMSVALWRVRLAELELRRRRCRVVADPWQATRDDLGS